MQEPIFPDTVTRKLYNERSILIGTFLGGPLAGGYLIAQNFKTLKQPRQAGITWLVTLVVLVLLILSVFVPALDKVPPLLFSFIFCMSAHFLAKNFQGRQIELHQQGGGQLYSAWRAAGFGLIALVLMLGWALLLLTLAGETLYP